MSRVYRRRKDCIHVEPGTPRQPPGSQYVSERLRKAQTAEAVIEAICAGQQVALD